MIPHRLTKRYFIIANVGARANRNTLERSTYQQSTDGTGLNVLNCNEWMRAG